jgi:hypothetical protein
MKELVWMSVNIEYVLNFQARGSQLDHVSSRNMDDNAHQPEPDLFTPDESPLSESLEQFWYMIKSNFLND